MADGEGGGGGSFLTQKLGPLPMWAWIAVVSLGGIALLTIGENKKAAAATPAAAQPQPAAQSAVPSNGSTYGSGSSAYTGNGNTGYTAPTYSTTPAASTTTTPVATTTTPVATTSTSSSAPASSAAPVAMSTAPAPVQTSVSYVSGYGDPGSVIVPGGFMDGNVFHPTLPGGVAYSTPAQIAAAEAAGPYAAPQQ